MLEKSFGMFYFLKRPKTKEKINRYVYLRITTNGESRELSMKRRWPVNRWDQSLGRATGADDDARNLNVYLDMISAKIYQARLSFIANEKQITANSLKNLVTGQGEKKMLLELITTHNTRVEALLNKGFALATIKRYRTIYHHSKDFILWKYKASDLNINDLNYEFASEYAFWLKAFKNCNTNSVIKYIGTLKKIVMEAVKKGWLKGDPFIDFKLIKEEVLRTALTKEELDIMSKKNFVTDRLNNVKDIFLFCCYTGLAYVDINNLKRANIITGIDGTPWIMIQRQKTGTPSRIPLLSIPLEIMNKYQDHPKSSTKDCILPVLTNQKMNAYLKEIADICGINKNLTFHIARHTFATTITLNNGVPIETVSKMLGHKSLQHTQHYAKILDTKVSEDMASLKRRLSV